jgi:hypothetical protein
MGRPLFVAPLVRSLGRNGVVLRRNPAWTPSAEGKRFLEMVRAKQSGDDIPVTVVVNWQSELKEVI